MNRIATLGGALTVTGLVGYVIGVTTAYPGRAFSVTVFMAGVSLIAMRRAFDDGAVAG